VNTLFNIACWKAAGLKKTFSTSESLLFIGDCNDCNDSVFASATETFVAMVNVFLESKTPRSNGLSVVWFLQTGDNDQTDSQEKQKRCA
jgi:hypothetical protein